MSGQHRATHEDWEYIRLRAEDGVGLLNCILELRARVEALEATQHAHAGIDIATLTSAEKVELGHFKAALEGAPTTEARPAERLWERMEDAGRRELHDNPHAEQAEFYQAMLREVAAWFTTITPRGSEAWRMASEVLRQEADRG